MYGTARGRDAFRAVIRRAVTDLGPVIGQLATTRPACEALGLPNWFWDTADGRPPCVDDRSHPECVAWFEDIVDAAGRHLGATAIAVEELRIEVDGWSATQVLARLADQLGPMPATPRAMRRRAWVEPELDVRPAANGEVHVRIRVGPGATLEEIRASIDLPTMKAVGAARGETIRDRRQGLVHAPARLLVWNGWRARSPKPTWREVARLWHMQTQRWRLPGTKRPAGLLGEAYDEWVRRGCEIEEERADTIRIAFTRPSAKFLG
jgi:hypothetical protein